MTDGLARVIRELDEFIMGTSKVHQTLERLARRLAELDVEFALAGALAVGVRRHLWRAAQASPDR